jgi:hypothetical protein
MSTPTPAPAPTPEAPTAVPPVWTQVSFYLTILTYILPLATLIFHKDVSGDAQGIASLAAAIATAVFLGKNAYEQVAHKKLTLAYHQMLLDQHNVTENQRFASSLGVSQA